MILSQVYIIFKYLLKEGNKPKRITPLAREEIIREARLSRVEMNGTAALDKLKYALARPLATREG